MEPLTDLDELGREVLFSLPAEPNGLSLAELAEGILDARGPVHRGMVNDALRRIRRALGRNLATRRGEDGFGYFTTLYGLPAPEMPRVRRFAAFMRREPETRTEPARNV